MKTSSAKAKGRRLQQSVCASLLEIFPQLEPDDITSRGMGQNGVDVILTPVARRIVGDLAIECKNVESLNVVGVFNKHATRYPKATSVLVHSRNHQQPLCTVTLKHYLELLQISRKAGRH